MRNLATIRTVMSILPVTAQADATLLQAQGIMRTEKIRHLPVCYDEEVVGIVTARDINLAAALSENASSLKLSEFYHPHPYTVDIEESFEKVLNHMADHRIDSAIVKENGKLVGILTTTDICRMCGQLIGALKDSQK